MKILKYCFILLSITCFLVACSKDENENKPLTNDGNAPGQVSDINIINLSGRSKIDYTLPDDANLLYVKATYTLDTGEKREVKSSFYKSSLIIDGYAAAGEHDVKISTVNRSEVASEPVTVKVNPKESPLFDVFKSLEVGPTFGGVVIQAENPERAQLAILYLEKNEQGDWVTSGNSIYTSTDSIYRTVRGLDTINYDLAFTVRDRFLNTSDTLFKTIKPNYETEIPTSGYAAYPLPGDAPTNDFNHAQAVMWNDDNIYGFPSTFITDAAVPAPHSFTFDIGQKVKISRIKIWDYPQTNADGRNYFWSFNMKKFEIWGSNNPSSDGSYDSWDLLGTYEETKPSGLPLFQNNDEDFRVGMQGFDWKIPISAPKYRYIRIKNLMNWGGGGRLAIASLRVYGDNR